MRFFNGIGNLTFEGLISYSFFMLVNVEQCSTHVHNKIAFVVFLFYVLHMTKEASLPVRLDVETSKALERISKDLHISKSAIIRMLAEAFVKYAEEHHGKVIIPPSFERYEVRRR